MVDAQTLLEAFLDLSLRYVCYINEDFFSDKKQNFYKCQIIWVSKLLDVGLQEYSPLISIQLGMLIQIKQKM